MLVLNIGRICDKLGHVMIRDIDSDMVQQLVFDLGNLCNPYCIKHKNDTDFDSAAFSKSIGHSSIRTTMEIHAHLDMAQNRFVQSSIEELKVFCFAYSLTFPQGSSWTKLRAADDIASGSCKLYDIQSGLFAHFPERQLMKRAIPENLHALCLLFGGKISANLIDVCGPLPAGKKIIFRKTHTRQNTSCAYSPCRSKAWFIGPLPLPKSSIAARAPDM